MYFLNVLILYTCFRDSFKVLQNTSGFSADLMIRNMCTGQITCQFYV